MATLDDILGGSGGTPPPKGSQEWHEQQGNGTSSPSPKGSKEWVEQNSGNNATPPAPAVKPVTVEQTKTIPTPPAQESLSYADLYKKLNPYTPPTEEELAKEKKKQKREQIFNAIGDGISAFANLYFTTQYAPNMYSKGNNLTGRAQVRYDKLMKDREEKNEKYYTGLWRAMQADDRKAEVDRAWQRQLGIDEYNRKRNDAKDERDRQLFDLNVQLQEQKISATEAEAKRKGIEAKYAEELAKAKVDTEKARGKAQSASASASSARAKYYNEGGGNGSKYYGNFDGKDYKTKADYDEAVTAAANELGIAVTEEQPDGMDAFMNPKTKTVRRPISEVAAEVNKKRKEKKANPMGGKKSNNGKKKNPMS